MRRVVCLLAGGALAFAIAGCSCAPAGGPAAAPRIAPTESAASKAWTALPMGPNESQRLRTMAPLLSRWAAGERTSGRTPADLTGITPRLVGYQVQLWAGRSKGPFTVLTIAVTDGRVGLLGSLKAKLSAHNVTPVTGQPSHPTVIEAKSAGELDAIAKALAWANAQLPGKQWSAGIQGYQFYYPLPAGYLLFVPDATAPVYQAIGG